MIIEVEITDTAITDYLEACAVERGITLADLAAEIIEAAARAASDNH